MICIRKRDREREKGEGWGRQRDTEVHSEARSVWHCLHSYLCVWAERVREEEGEEIRGG